MILSKRGGGKKNTKAQIEEQCALCLEMVTLGCDSLHQGSPDVCGGLVRNGSTEVSASWRFLSVVAMFYQIFDLFDDRREFGLSETKTWRGYTIVFNVRRHVLVWTFRPDGDGGMFHCRPV